MTTMSAVPTLKIVSCIDEVALIWEEIHRDHDWKDTAQYQIENVLKNSSRHEIAQRYVIVTSLIVQSEI